MAEVDDGWVLFLLGDQQYGLSIKNLEQMVVLEDILQPPTYQDYLRGIINIRGQTVPVLDLRQRLGMRSSETESSEFLQLIAQRKQDHINWLEELYRCVDEERKFTLATDPHQCAFGRWYDTYETSNPVLSFHLKKFDAPHQRIHGIAQKVDALVVNGKKQEAHDLIQQTRNTDLAEMIQLFDEVGQVLKAARREIVLVNALLGERCGFLVDEVCAVRDVPATSIQSVQNLRQVRNSEQTVGVADVDGRPTIFLDATELARDMQISAAS